LKTPFLLHETLTFTAERFADKTALVCGDERWSYNQIDEQSTQLASLLRSLGIECQDRVLIFQDNSCEGVVSVYGALKAGGVFVFLNSLLKARKLAYIVRDSRPRFLIAHTSKASILREVAEHLGGLPCVIWVGDRSAIPAGLSEEALFWDEVLQERVSPSSRAGVNPLVNGNTCIDMDLAALIYTSGSTGEPKGVMAPHGNMMAVARSIIHYLENSADDVIFNVLPLSFGYGLYQVLTAFMVGAAVVLEKSFLFQAKVLERMEKEGATAFPMVPTIAAMLLRLKNFHKYDLTSLRYMTNAAAALPVEHIRKLRGLLPHVRLYSMYGLTECQRVSYLPPEELDRRPSSAGKAIPNCQVFLMDEQGKEVPVGEVGELAVRGANVMRGYWNAPELTTRSFRNDIKPGETLLFSGDLFRKDEEGFLYFVARKDDLIKTRGERVSPRELEMVLCELDGVSEAAVVGVPDDILGQAVKACVVPVPGAKIRKRDVLKHCADCLESFMVPKHVEFHRSLPRTAHGKINKEALRETQKA
jgi:long-chain acyl-CoA synthetase